MSDKESYREVYHHLGILVVAKPSGLPSQSTRKQDDNLYDMLKQKHAYVGLHHRLDRPASGLMLFCTDRRCNATIANAFRQRRIKRKYKAFVLGSPPKEGVWEMPIDGKAAQSTYKVLTQYAGFALVDVELQTGRTHQIRKHAQMAGHPILGDRRYGGAAGRLWPRLCLHAAELHFKHPMTKEDVECQCQLPLDMADVATQLG